MEEVFRQAHLDLKEVQRLLGDDKAEAGGRAQALEETLHRYHANLYKIQEWELQKKAFSPILPFDQLIKAAFNVLQQKCPPLELQTRFPAAVSYLANLRYETALRRTLYPEVEWPEALETGFVRMEGGLGAFGKYLETGTPAKTLEEGIQLLGRGSTDYAEQMEALQLAGRAKHSKHDSVEQWLRLREQPYDLGQEATGLLWQRLYFDTDQFFALVQRAKQSGLGVVEPELLKNAAMVHQQTVDRLANLSAEWPGLEAGKELLNTAWDLMDYLKQRIASRLAEVQKMVEPAPRMRELLDTLGQVQSGLLPTWLLQSDLQKRIAEQKKVVEAMEAAPEKVNEEILSLTRSHDVALQRMLLYCEDENADHLIEGWKLIALTLPPLIEFDRSARQAVAQKGTSSRSVTCVRCGEVQLPQKVCQKCGAALPQVQLDDVRYMDLAGEQGPSGNPAEYLHELIAGLQLGGSSWEQIGGEIVKQLEVVDKTRERFEKEMLPMLGKDNNLDVYAQFLAVRLGQLTQCLLALLDAVNARNPLLMQGAIAPYRELFDEIGAFQARINEAIGKK